MKIMLDENFNGDIYRGLLRRRPDLDLVRVQDVGLVGVDDPALLAWAASEQRVLFTHDVSTITHHAYQRVRRGESMPGVFEVSRGVPISSVIEDVLLLAEASEPDEWEGQVRYLPL